jgi:hypothetical protein
MIEERYVTLAHGNGGRFTRELISDCLPAISPIRSSTRRPMPLMCRCPQTMC